MTLLVDWQIEGLIIEKGVVEPYNPYLLNPASLDVTLGDEIILFRRPLWMPFWLGELCNKKGWLPQKRISIKNNPFFMRPGDFVLACTAETFHLPDDIALQFCLKSSRARIGIESLEAGYCDPGWNNSVLTIEMMSVNPIHSIPIEAGMRIGQMKFFKTEKVETSYKTTGHYNGDKTVMGSKV